MRGYRRCEREKFALASNKAAVVPDNVDLREPTVDLCDDSVAIVSRNAAVVAPNVAFVEPNAARVELTAELVGTSAALADVFAAFLGDRSTFVETTAEEFEKNDEVVEPNDEVIDTNDEVIETNDGVIETNDEVASTNDDLCTAKDDASRKKHAPAQPCASAGKTSGAIARVQSRPTLDRVLRPRIVGALACAIASLGVPVLSCGGTTARVSAGDAGPVEEASGASTGDAGVAEASGEDGATGGGAGLQSGAAWPMFAQGPGLRGRSAAVGPASPTVKWVFPAQVTAQPAVAADGTIYFGTEDGTLVALRADGSVKWTFAAGGSVSFGGTPAIRADGSVLVGARSGAADTGQLYAVSSTGTLLWMVDTSRATNLAPPSPSVADDGTIYISSAYHLYAIHPDGSPAWQADAGDEYVIVPAIGADGTVYVGGQYGLQAFTPGGQQKWAFGPCADLVSECTSQETVADDGTIVTTMTTLSQDPGAPGYLLTAVHPDGTQAWSLDLFTMGVGAAVWPDGTILLPTGNYLASVSAAGQQNWASVLPGASGGAAPVVDAAGNVYLGTSAWTEAAPCGSPCEELSGAGLQAFHPDGTSAWVLEPDIAFASPAIGADGTLYAAAVGGGDAGVRQGIGLYAVGP